MSSQINVRLAQWHGVLCNFPSLFSTMVQSPLNGIGSPSVHTEESPDNTWPVPAHCHTNWLCSSLLRAPIQASLPVIRWITASIFYKRLMEIMSEITSRHTRSMNGLFFWYLSLAKFPRSEHRLSRQTNLGIFTNRNKPLTCSLTKDCFINYRSSV